jgi:hypothetical protein
MVKVTTTILAVFIAVGSVAGASYPAAAAKNQTSAPADRVPDASTEDTGWPAEPPPTNVPLGDTEEESEEKDETSKEKIPQRVTTLFLTSILEQLYCRQLLMFDAHQPDVATPPPKS